MDVSQSITYRGLNINGAVLQTGRVLRGISVEQVDYSDIEVVGYTEKRAGADGIHASDVYLGRRTLDMRGLIYAVSLAEMFDYLHTMRSVFSPTSAYIDSPADRGFLPLLYSQSTTDTASFPGGNVPLYMNVRPASTLRFTIDSGRQQQTGGKKSTSTPWSVRLLAKDPRVYVNPAQQVDVSGAPAGQQDRVAINRGDYETPFNIQLVIGASVPIAGAEFRVTGLKDSLDMKIKVEAKANVIYRWFGDDRVLMTEDTTAGVGTAPLVMRMDLVTFATKNRRPTVPASINPPSRPFSTPWHFWRTNLTLAAGSMCFWGEAFA